MAVTPGNVADSQEFIALVDPEAGDVTTAKGYDTNANHQRLKDNSQCSSIIVKKSRTNVEMISQPNPVSQRERPNIERKFAEQKKYHGLGKVRHWGLAKVTIQVLLTCIAVRQAHRPEQSRREEVIDSDTSRDDDQQPARLRHSSLRLRRLKWCP